MLHNTIQIALGIVYGIYLAFLAPASQRQKAHDWAKQQDTAANTSEQLVFFQVEPTVVASKPGSSSDVELLEDPWLAEPSFTTTQSQEETIAIAAVPSISKLWLLPPAQMSIEECTKTGSRKKVKSHKTKQFVAQKVPSSTEVKQMTVAQLRSLCSKRNIKWRNTNGSKHLTKAEMITALCA